MSAHGDTSKAAIETGAESPTTARPLEMDDDDVQETGIIGVEDTPAPATAAEPKTSTAAAAPPAAADGAPPPKPPRPLTEAQKNETILREAFPPVDTAVIRAVLRASGGQVEPAFNALLEMTDPEAAKNEPEDVPPPKPRRPQGRTPMSQVEADELYARQLAEHYDNVGAYEARTSHGSRGARRGNYDDDDDEDYNDREHSFIDDDLPVIRENLRKGFLETQTKVNGWITNLRKKIEENFDESEEGMQRQRQTFQRQGEASRRSGDYDRYDADPQVLSDDFAGMKFSADGTPANRTANPTLHRPPPPSLSSRPSDGRRVGFKEETEEINMYDSSPRVPFKEAALPSSMKPSKWQPLSTVEPAPMGDNDPFSLGDSEDEKDTRDKAKDAKTNDSEHLKKAAAEAMSDNLVDAAKAGDSAPKKE